MLISEKYAIICSFCFNLYEQNWKDLTIFTNFSTNVCFLRKDEPKTADFVPKKSNKLLHQEFSLFARFLP